MTGLADSGVQADVAAIRYELDRTRRERDAARTFAARVDAENEQLRRALGFIDAAEGASLDPPKWLAPAPTKAAKRATLVLMLSDLHFDEVVRPEEVKHLNAYNRTIAELRLKAWTANAVKMARHYLSGVTYDGVVLLLGGDTFSGDIHEELQQTNEDVILGSLLHWTEQMGAAVEVLAGEFGKLHVAAVPGNHGRQSRKPRAKLRARTNFDWLAAKMLERHYGGDKRITFQVSDGADTLVSIYGHGHLMNHGETGGGQGIGGIWPPIMRLRARKTAEAMATGQTFSTFWIGHWHQYTSTPYMVINGAMKGYDEYAIVNAFGFEVPQQALAIVTPEHNITVQAPVFCMDRAAEKW